MDLITKLVALYDKIQMNKATIEEITRFNLEIEKSCMDSESLMNLIRKEWEKKRV